MDVMRSGFLDVMSSRGVRFVIPAYQRLYSWTEAPCDELWLDIMRAARAERSHFMGTLLYNASHGDEDGICHEIIDGQQRMMSISLILLALARYLEGHPDTRVGEGLDGTALRERYLIMGDRASGGPITKLRPARHDICAYERAIRGDEGLSESPIARNLAFFQDRMEAEGFDAHQLFAGLQRLVVIVVDAGDPLEARSIFESINSKGMPLNVADMVRNYMLLAESHDEQARWFEEYWKPSQEMFFPDPGSLKLNTGIKSWLAIRLKGARVLSAEQVYSSFKRYVEDAYQGEKEPILRELRGFCLMWAENYRYHGVKKFRSGSDWAELGAPALTASYPLKKANNEEYARRVREELRNADSRW